MLFSVSDETYLEGSNPVMGKDRPNALYLPFGHVHGFCSFAITVMNNDNVLVAEFHL